MKKKDSIRFDYPIKILVAWGEAISGNAKIRDWLITNDYPELGLFTFALRNKDEAKIWLLENNFPHLLALINGIEGNPEALKWLDESGFKTLSLMALTADHSDEAGRILASKDKLLLMLALKMGAVKDAIELDNNDVHKMSPD